MNGWFSKPAGSVFKSEVPDAPQPYIIRCCSCGEEQRGLRQAEFQRLVCKVCETPLFILPRDVYPVPAVKVEPTVESGTTGAIAVLEEESFSSQREESKPAQKQRKRKNSVKQKRDKKPSAPAALPTLSELRQRIRDAEKPKRVEVAEAVPQKPGALDGVGTALGEMGRGAHREFVRFWSPFRILALVVVIVMLFTGAWTIRQSLLANAVKIAKQEGELGLAAIDSEDWTKARDHLQRAAAALDRLGRTDAESQTIRQYARETQAQFGLCDLSLEELLTKAQAELQGRDQKDDRKNRLLIGYQGDWMVIEGLVRDVGKGNSRSRNYEIQLPAGPHGQQAIIRVNFPVLREMIPLDGQKSLLLAGAIQDIELTKTGQWMVTLNPASGFLWTHLNTYRAIGFEFNPLKPQAVVEEELRIQARAMGVPP